MSDPALSGCYIDYVAYTAELQTRHGRSRPIERDRLSAQSGARIGGLIRRPGSKGHADRIDRTSRPEDLDTADTRRQCLAGRTSKSS